MWLKEIFDAINESPWTAFFVGFWLLLMSCAWFVEKEKS